MQPKDRVVDLVAKGMNAVHQAALRLSGGRLGTNVFGMPAVELHTIGKRSGQRRTVMLTVPVDEPGRVVLVASKGGDDRHPDWYHNVVAHPEVELTRGGLTSKMVARTATAAEKAELWPRITEAYKGYAGYQQRTDREIPVIICEPA